ncbi:MAG TPA: prolyl oligopeptidase family serine peptidase, partial [Chthoniobacteraceae bacterium]|nr:prolyl oligopeptidase family serine peptidase [Chthoniobacteraceae bacterium]
MKCPPIIAVLLFAGTLCACRKTAEPVATQTLPQARAGFVTKLIRKDSDGEPAPEPPEGVLQLVNYRGPLGGMPAYVTPRPAGGGRHPAIIWITGGFSNSISPVQWKPAPATNDQSARAFREAGIVTMYPSMRGGNDSPGFMENFYGEVDDVLAAVDYLAKLDYVDPARIYLGGHSTGGTVAMLVAESSDRFRAVFAFGPIDDVRHYDPKELGFDLSDPRESDLRSPVKWLQGIRTPVFALEGTDKPSNIGPLKTMAGASRNPLAHFIPVRGATHFTILAPVTSIIAQKILLDNGP